jgi:hypothetical protein
MLIQRAEMQAYMVKYDRTEGRSADIYDKGRKKYKIRQSRSLFVSFRVRVRGGCWDDGRVSRLGGLGWKKKEKQKFFRREKSLYT